GLRLQGSAALAFAIVDEDYFETIQLPLVAGRVPATGAQGPPFAAVITQSLADRVWPGRDPIGERFRLDPTGRWMTVAGIVPDMRFGSIDYPFGALCVFVPRSP